MQSTALPASSLSVRTSTPSRNTSGMTRSVLGSDTPKLTETQIADIREAFEVFDHNADGYLDFHELRYAMLALGFDTPKPDVLKILEEVDPVAKRVIGLPEFESLMKARMLTRDPDEDIVRAFELFDVNESGYIDLESLKQVAKRLEESISEAEIKAMIEAFDLDGDGRISLDEFRRLCTQ